MKLLRLVRKGKSGTVHIVRRAEFGFETTYRCLCGLAGIKGPWTLTRDKATCKTCKRLHD